MGFNFGAFAGGMSDGITSGSNLADQMQQRKLRQAQIDAFSNTNLGEQAYTNAMIPGMVGMPQGAGQGGGSVLSRMPIIGPLGAELGLWGAPPPAQAPMLQQMAGMPGQPQRLDMGARQPGQQPQALPSMAGMPGQPAQGMPQASGQPAGGMPGQPAGGMPGQPGTAGIDANMIAMGIDRANPGLRQSNPAAFSAAVKMGLAFAKEQAASALDTRFKEAQISGMGSENKLREAQAANIPVQTDLTRAQIDNQRAELSIKGEELKMVPAKLKLQEAEVKLRETQQEVAQAKMRLDEAEMQAKTGDYGSQKEYRDAQIASIRAERMLKMQKQKSDQLVEAAQAEELRTRSGKNEAEAGYLGRKGIVDGTQDKLINQELTKAQVQFRFHQNQINDLMTSMNPNDPKIKERINMHMRDAAAYGQRVKDLEGQLSTAPKTDTVPNPFSQTTTEVPPARQSELGKISQKLVEFAQTNDKASAIRLLELMKAKGVPQHEIDWARENARTMSQAPKVQGPQVPQSR